MSKSVDVPTEYTIHSTVSGSLDMDLDNIRIRELPTVNMTSTVDIGLDDIRIKELPRIDLQTSMKPTRVHLPVNYKLGLSALGMEILSFSVCGEGMVIVEDYIPRKTEACV